MQITLPLKLDKNFHYDVEHLKNLSHKFIQDFKKQLELHPNYKLLKDNFIFDDNSIIHILQRIPIGELAGFSQEERLLYPLCSKNEIYKIFNPKTAKDYLLKIRAENISNNIRLHRVFITIRKNHGESWSFTEYIDSKLFNDYLNFLPKDLRKKCESIPHGIVHLRDANGFCMKTPKGNIIVVSEALKYFLYYMNMFVLGEQLGLAEKDVSASFWIAVRIMLGFEPLDFEVDTRGDIPENAHIEIMNSTEWQLRFIIGHEYAHHYLKHLESGIISEINLHQNNKNISGIKKVSYPHQKEFDADLFSIQKTDVSDDIRSSLTNGGLYFFHFLDLLETVTDYMLPSGKVKSHPNAIDRLWHLRSSIDDKYGIPESDLKKYIASYDNYKNMIIKNILPFDTELIESYSSIYLPSYKSTLKIDRLDY